MQQVLARHKAVAAALDMGERWCGSRKSGYRPQNQAESGPAEPLGARAARGPCGWSARTGFAERRNGVLAPARNLVPAVFLNGG